MESWLLRPLGWVEAQGMGGEGSQRCEGEVGKRPETHVKGSGQRHHGHTALLGCLSGAYSL